MLTMAKFVWAFDITSTEPVDTNFATGYLNGFVTSPLKFPAKFVPRSEKHIEVIEKEAVEAEKFMSRFE